MRLSSFFSSASQSSSVSLCVIVFQFLFRSITGLTAIPFPLSLAVNLFGRRPVASWWLRLFDLLWSSRWILIWWVHLAETAPSVPMVDLLSLRAVHRPRRAAAADNLWAPPPPTFVDRRATADNLSPIPLLLRSYFWEFSMTSSLSSLPSGRSRPPMVSCFSMLSFFFKFAVFLAHHPVQ